MRRCPGWPGLHRFPRGGAPPLERRRALGLDRLDEVWEGEYRVVPGPSPQHAQAHDRLSGALRPRAEAAGLRGLIGFHLGTAHDYRVPDLGYVTSLGEGIYLPTAVVVVEVLSPGDDSYAKFGFYAAHGVQEVIVADPVESWVKIYALADPDVEPGRSGYREVTRSDVLDVDAATLRAAIS